MALLEVDDIDVFYGDLQALRGVSMDIEEGSFTVLLGPNGAGKTTLVKTVSGLQRPRNGQIRFEGERIDEVPAHEIPGRGIAHVPEGAATFPDMSVLDNLKLGGHAAARDEQRERLEWVYDLFPQLEERKNKLASTLSGGERQMLSIGRGLMLGPDLLILDEPSLGLAPSIVTQIFDLIDQLQDEGLTLLLIEQNARKALELADYGYVLESSELVIEGDAEDLADREEVEQAYLGG
jgi:branched-chain amino acid transport system ATP-binding protein